MSERENIGKSKPHSKYVDAFSRSSLTRYEIGFIVQTFSRHLNFKMRHFGIYPCHIFNNTQLKPKACNNALTLMSAQQSIDFPVKDVENGFGFYGDPLNPVTPQHNRTLH